MRWGGWAAGVVGVIAGGAGCAGYDESDTTSAPAAGSGTADEACLEAPASAGCIDEARGVFVAPGGHDSAQGTRATPLGSITAAVERVAGERDRIFVCEGTYAEQLEIRKSVTIIGGLACSWDRAGAKAVVESTRGEAVRVLGTSAVVLANLEVRASAVQETGTAVGIFVAASRGIVLHRVDVIAADGKMGTDGRDGAASSNYEARERAADGLASFTTAGGQSGMCGRCADGSFSTAGEGATANGKDATHGGSSPAIGLDNAGASGEPCSHGSPGMAGLAAKQGAEGGARAGALEPGGWLATPPAAPGPNGGPGQGGGGGGCEHTPTSNRGGGAGGCGGCGGKGGSSGGSGGSSLGVLSFDAELLLRGCAITVGRGGAGGRGGQGERGQLGGGGAVGLCYGAAGGHGAGGGGGGGGAGGHSIGIAYAGTKPVTSALVIRVATPGAGGEGGLPGDSEVHPGPRGLVGARGSATDLLSFEP